MATPKEKKAIQSKTCKAVVEEIRELVAADKHNEAGQLWHAWTMRDDYDSKAATYRFTMMGKAGVRTRGWVGSWKVGIFAIGQEVRFS